MELDSEARETQACGWWILSLPLLIIRGVSRKSGGFRGPNPTHDEETVMNGAPRLWVGHVDLVIGWRLDVVDHQDVDRADLLDQLETGLNLEGFGQGWAGLVRLGLRIGRRA